MQSTYINTEILESPSNDESNEQPTGSARLIERQFSDVFKQKFNKLVVRMSMKKVDSNTFGWAMRLFKVPSTAILGFPQVQCVRAQLCRGVSAMYIIRLHNVHPEGFTHGIYVRLTGYVNRRLFETFIEDVVECLTGGRLSLKTVVPVLKKTVPLFDYLQSIYVMPSNLLVNLSHHQDVVAAAARQQRTDNKTSAQLKGKITLAVSSLIDTMIALPSQYPDTYLTHTLGLTTHDFRKLMRSTNISEIMLRVGQDAYNIALQDKKFRPVEVQELMDPMTRRSILNRCMTAKATKQVQLLFQQTYGIAFVHPHPYNGIIKSDLGQLKALDGLIFDPRFLFSILLTSRWFVRACMLEDNSTSNNHAHLVLYGGAGTGKTLLASAISSSIPTYKYLVTSRFQNPDLLQASLLSIEEFSTSALPTNQYKLLLDLKTSVKIDFKNLNPENVTEGVPCMITTNDEVLTILGNTKRFEVSSAAAALRRLYLIPLKAGPFEKLHGRVPQASPYFGDLCCYDTKFDREPNKLQRIFNLIFAFALFQQDIRGLYIDPGMHAYIQKTIKDFSRTAFGTFYLANKTKVDEIVSDVEHTMMEQDLDDSGYLVKVSTCAGQFQQLLQQFIAANTEGIVGLNSAIVKDKQIPWPIKAYYLLANVQFHIKMMLPSIDAEKLLNAEVAQFLTNPVMQLFNVPEQPFEPYQDLRLVNSSSQRSDFDEELKGDPFFEDEEAKYLTPPKLVRTQERRPEAAHLDLETVFPCTPVKRSLAEVFNLESELKVREETQQEEQYDDCTSEFNLFEQSQLSKRLKK